MVARFFAPLDNALSPSDRIAIRRFVSTGRKENAGL